MNWLTQRRKAIHGHTERGQAIPHIDSAPARMHTVDDNFAQTAMARSFGNQFTKGGDVRNGLKLGKALALADQGNHLVHKTVETDSDRGQRRGNREEAGSQIFRKGIHARWQAEWMRNGNPFLVTLPPLVQSTQPRARANPKSPSKNSDHL